MEHQQRSGERPSTMEWVKKTALYQEWASLKAEIERHKWIESEKAGHDIGWDRASVDWMIRHKR